MDLVAAVCVLLFNSEGSQVFVTVRATCRSSPEKDEGIRSGRMVREVVTLRV